MLNQKEMEIPAKNNKKRNNLANNHVAVAPCTYLLRKS